MMTVAALVSEARQRLSAAGIEDAGLEARILVAGLFGMDASSTISRGNDPVAPSDLERARQAIAERIAGKPVHRILGHRGFRDLDLVLSPATLEPRPDTETLIDAVLPLLTDIVNRKGAVRILDLGTGTGAIALALLDAEPMATAVATDISAEALATTRTNAVRHGLSDRLETVRADWFDGLDGLFDVIVSNPPYIATSAIDGLDREVREHDPIAALDGGPDGLDAYRAIARGAFAHLEPNGHVAVEIGFDQRDTVTALFEAAGFARTGVFVDFGGRDRVLVFRASGKNRQSGGVAGGF